MEWYPRVADDNAAHQKLLSLIFGERKKTERKMQEYIQHIAISRKYLLQFYLI